MMEQQILQAFATPIGHFVFPDYESLNSELKRIILDREQSEDGIVRSNIGGWHSQGNLLSWPFPELDTFQARLLQALQSMSNHDSQTESPVGFEVKAWANVCRYGDYHTIHNHPTGVWSGVYYIDPGSDAPGRPNSGVLELVDPRVNIDLVGLSCSQQVRNILCTPEEGRLVIFPSWLNHFVHPYYGEGLRITIAFNAVPVRVHPTDRQ